MRSYQQDARQLKEDAFKINSSFVRPLVCLWFVHYFKGIFNFKYRKILIIRPGLIFVQKTFLLGLFSGELIEEALIIGGNFAFQNGLGLTMKIAQNTKKTV